MERYSTAACIHVVAQVCMYNMIQEHGSLMKRQQAADRMFPKGSRLAIMEPFFKVMASGEPGVRVDNPKEVRCYIRHA